MTLPLTPEQKIENENKSTAVYWVRDADGNMIRDVNGKRWWMDGYLKQNFDFVQTKVSHKIAHRRSDLFVIIDGPVGSGKSTLSFQCARYFDPTFDLSRVVFSVDEFLRVIIDAKPGQAVVFDEAIIVNSRSALTEFNKKVIIAMTQIRSKGLYIFFNIPSVFDLDRNLVLNRCHLLLHCFQDTFGDRGRYLSFDHDKLKMLYLKGKRLYTYAYPKANFFARFTEYFPLDRLEYENKKQKEIAKQAKPSKTHKWIRQRNKLMRFMVEENKRFFPGMTKMEICTKLAELVGHIEPFQVENVVYNGDDTDTWD